MERRLRERLRALAARKGAALVERPPRRAASTSGGWSRLPSRDGRLIVWREQFEDSRWPDGDGARLFGPGVLPSRLRDLYAENGIDADALAFVDIETCGLADRPVFLAGILSFRDRALELVQRLAPDPSAEPEMLRRTSELLGRRADWVSFNGLSFDVPRLRSRCRLHGIPWPDCRSHRDLLHDVRRRWKRTLPDCRLGTVERRLLGLDRRDGDVPGREVPERYHDFVEAGDARWLDPVIEHNRRDVAALAALLLRLLAV